jgi:hypothetical protein
MKLSRLAWLAVLLAATACSGGNQTNSARPTPAATNPTDFPLFSGAEVLASHAWRQTITSHPNAADNALLTQGSGTYDGHDVVAGTQALMPSLETWLRDLQAHPPDGYTAVLDGVNIEAVRTHTRVLGMDFDVFEGTENGKRHGVAVLAVDPQTLDAKAGSMLGMIAKFRLLPQSIRDSIDVQAKKQTGFTVTELTDPDTPIGAAVAGLDQLRDYGGRGVVLIDAVKE